MKLAQLATKPQLVQITINDSHTVETYGEPVEFYIYDRQDMATYMELSKLEGADIATVTSILSKLVLDENGAPILNEENLLPIDLMVKVVEEVAQRLGNLGNQTTTK